jgi:hypothetical protein
MSLGIALKGPEGLVLAADSRVTLFNQLRLPTGQQTTVPASFDNATKLLRVKDQDYVAAVTYGAGAIGQQQPRTAHSFLPEFEQELGSKRLSVEEFARKLGAFFLRQWREGGMPVPAPVGVDMVFLVGGYDKDAAYGRVFEIHVPSSPEPIEKIPAGQFGAVWGGQREITDRIIQGFDQAAIAAIYEILGVPADQQKAADLENQLKAKLALKVPVQFLPLQDCVDLTIFLIRATILAQKWAVDVRGVGGAVDVATITRTAGFKAVQLKEIVADNII